MEARKRRRRAIRSGAGRRSRWNVVDKTRWMCQHGLSACLKPLTGIGTRIMRIARCRRQCMVGTGSAAVDMLWNEEVFDGDDAADERQQETGHAPGQFASVRKEGSVDKMNPE